MIKEFNEKQKLYIFKIAKLGNKENSFKLSMYGTSKDGNKLITAYEGRYKELKQVIVSTPIINLESVKGVA